ncbi:MAG: rod shape-determining protein MreC [Bacteroidota bacterium]
MIVIFRWIRNRAYPLLFVVLLISSLLQIVQYNLYQRSVFFNQTLGFYRKIDKEKSDITAYFDLKQQNEALLLENQLLRNQLSWNLQSTGVFNEVQINDSNTKSFVRFEQISAQVVKNSTNRRNNFIIIDKGKKHGISKNMAVVGPNGIVGIIFESKDNYSLVLSVLNSKFELTPYIREITLNQGVISWDGSNPRFIDLLEVNRFEKVKKGMKLFTSNYSLIFPAGIPIGTINDVKTSLTSNFHEITIQLSTDFTRLNQVTVIKLKEQLELEQIQQTIQQNEENE